MAGPARAEPNDVLEHADSPAAQAAGLFLFQEAVEKKPTHGLSCKIPDRGLQSTATYTSSLLFFNRNRASPPDLTRQEFR
jgi:hypothetical protein